MKRVNFFLIALLACMVSSSAFAVLKQGDDVTYHRAKSGLLMSAGVIELVKKEGEISLEDERITCHKTRKTGSHLKETFCLTLHEADVSRTRNQRTMWRYLNGITR
ncbi:MAG: hypothetical protein MI750_11615 [Xanthomonadales bacterium]|jgi:hypothetical protein|nr:hypothetical protein [Xanthomonadales bacterium]